MRTVSAALFGAFAGGLIMAVGLVTYLDWGTQGVGQLAHVDPTRADYVDLMLTLVTVVLASVGLAVTVGALVVGLVAFTMAADLEPNVNAKVRQALPTALQAALLDEELGHRILSDMAQRGELDQVLERVAMRMQGGGPEAIEEEGS